MIATRLRLLALVSVLGVLLQVDVGRDPALRDARAASGPRSILRQQDVGLDDPIRGVHWTWTAPPAGRALAGQTFCYVKVVSPTEGGPPATIAFGIIDLPGVAGPVMASYCGNCFDAARGSPPSEGWKPWGNHGTLTGTVTLDLNFDAQNARWAWFINGELMRWEEGPLMGPGLRVAAGADFEADGEIARNFWHSDIQTFRERAGWQMFEPNDASWPEIVANGSTVSYDPTGTVMVHADEESVAAAAAGSAPIGQRGGAGGPIVAVDGRDQVLAARGPAIHSVDVQREAVTALLQLTSTVTAMIALPDGALVGTHAGRIVRMHEDGQLASGGPLEVGAPVAALAVGANGAVAGTATGEVIGIRLEPRLAHTGVATLGGRVRVLLAHEGRMFVGLESDHFGNPGEIFALRMDDAGRLAIDRSISASSSPVAIIPGAPGHVIVALASGEIRRIKATEDELADDGPLLVLPTVVTAMTGTFPRAYVLGDQGDVWTLGLEDAGEAVVLGREPLGRPGGGLGAAGGRLYLASEAGEIVAFDLADGLVGPLQFEDRDVGTVNGVFASTDSVTLLSGRKFLDHLVTTSPGAPIAQRLALPRRAVALRAWPGGVAVANGLAGVDLYDSQGAELISRLRLNGVSRDVAVSGETAYVASGTAGVHVIDLTDPELLVVATVPTSHLATSVAIQDRLLLVGQQGGNVLAFDRVILRNPRLLGEVEDTPNVTRLVIRDQDAFGLDQAGGMVRLSLRGLPGSVPELAETVRVARQGLDILPVDGAILIAGGRDGLRTVIADDNPPTVVRSAAVGPAIALGASSRSIHVASGPAGLSWWSRAGDYVAYLPTVRNLD